MKYVHLGLKRRVHGHGIKRFILCVHFKSAYVPGNTRHFTPTT
jgi:hypothetical protein